MSTDKAHPSHHAGHVEPASGLAHNPITSGLAGIALGLIIGYGAGQVSTGMRFERFGSVMGGNCSASIFEAQRKLVDSGFMQPLPTDATELSGRLTSISESQLTMTTDLRRLDPLGFAKLPAKRIVKLTDKTAYARYEQLSADELKRQRQAYVLTALKLGPETAMPAPPSPLKEIAISQTDLRVGDMVTIKATEDMLSKPSFEAVSVSLTPATN